MNAISTHWAAELIGKPWEPGNDGPDAYDCRGLVRHVWLTQKGIDVPPLARDIADNPHAIVDAAYRHGWEPVGRGLAVRAREFDIVMMTGPRGPHVGVMVEADGRLGLLHAVGGMVDGKPTGSVIFTPRLHDAADMGYGKFEFWRRAC